MSSPMSKSEERYRSDPAFHHMVKAIESVLKDQRLTPSEVREAAMLACYRFELRHPAPVPFFIHLCFCGLPACVCSL
jgi:hypothetical protein